MHYVFMILCVLFLSAPMALAKAVQFSASWSAPIDPDTRERAIFDDYAVYVCESPISSVRAPQGAPAPTITCDKRMQTHNTSEEQLASSYEAVADKGVLYFVVTSRRLVTAENGNVHIYESEPSNMATHPFGTDIPPAPTNATLEIIEILIRHLDGRTETLKELRDLKLRIISPDQPEKKEEQ